MKLSRDQVKWINQEKATLKRIIASNPEKGLFRLIARQEALQLIIELHNHQMDCEKQDAQDREKEVGG